MRLITAALLAAVLTACAAPGPSGTTAGTGTPASPTSASPPPAPPGPGTSEPATGPGGPGYLPRRDVTPGAVRTSSVADVCPSAHTSRVRPPATYTDGLKRTQLASDYAFLHLTAYQVEEDHLIPLELGGNPTDPKNLWPEPHAVTGPDGMPAGSAQKDHLENYLHAEVCAGRLGLAQAQQEIAADWYQLYVRAGRPTD